MPCLENNGNMQHAEAAVHTFVKIFLGLMSLTSLSIFSFSFFKTCFISLGNDRGRIDKLLCIYKYSQTGL